jgi:Dolichyl-phosphate-mannose-protein mannosyltransferase
MEERFSTLLLRTVLVGCLLGISATLYLVFGLAGYVHNFWLNTGVVAALGFSALFFLAKFFSIPTRTNWLGRILWAATLVLIVTQIALGLLPPTSRDELTHHLAIPKLYANAGRIIQVPIAPYAYYPMLLDMLYTPWVYWGYDFVPKLIHGLFAFLTGLLLFAYLSDRLNNVYGLLGLFLYLSMPAIARLSHWGYIDLGLAFYTTASLLCLLAWREQRDGLFWLSCAGVSLGFALATKPNGLLAALVIGMLFLLVIVRRPRQPVAETSREIGLFLGFTLLPFAPWVVKNWVQTGNPFFPLLNSWFLSHTGTATLSPSFNGVGILQKRHWLYDESLAQILALPLRIFFSGRDDHPQFFDGVLTPVLIAFLPWAFKGKWLEDKKLLTGFAAIFLFYALFLVDMRIRYILPIVPPLIILAVYGVFNIYLNIKRPIYLFAIVVAVGVWHGKYVWHYFREAAPIGFLSGAETRDAYLDRMLPEYSAFQYINHSIPPSARIYLLFVGRRAYYCDRNYFHDGGDLPWYLLAAITRAKNADQIIQVMREKNITHFIARDDLLSTFLVQNLTPSQAAVWNQFAQNRLTLMFRDRGHAVYKLHS